MSAYSGATTDKLYSLLPPVVREKDAAQGEPLRALLEIIENQADLIDAEIGQLGRDAFIETCEPWAIPYIGDLVGNTPLFDESQVHEDGTAHELFEHALNGPGFAPTIALSARADVARTIHFRRRKGTLVMLEELARDVTGWSVYVVPMFSLLDWTQWLRNHVRPHALRTLDLRSVERAGRVDGPFDVAMHTVDVRPIAQTEGWYAITNLAFFLWRLRAYPVSLVPARRLGAAGDFRYHFSQLGNSAPLFSRGRAPTEDLPLLDELRVPQAIRPARFFADLQAYAALASPPGFTDFYGLFDAVPGFNVAPSPSFMVLRDGTPIPPEQVSCRDLSVWTQPSGERIGIDAKLGRLALGPDLVPASTLEVYYHYGFPADVGGGPYARRAWLTKPDPRTHTFVVNDSQAPDTFPTIADALDEWDSLLQPQAVIRIEDNRTYAETLSIVLQPARGRFLTIEAADRFRPHLQLTGSLLITGDRPDFTFTLSGCLVEGSIAVQGSLAGLRLLHTTLVPGVSIAEHDPPVTPPPTPPPSVDVAATDANGERINTELILALAFSITGPLHVPEHARAVYVLDSVVDGVGDAALEGAAGDTVAPPLHVERSTIRGDVRVRQIDLATEVIFDGLALADRLQVGCVRFSYVTPGSHVPRRYRCQPDLAEQDAIDTAVQNGTVLTQTQIDDIRTTARRRVRPTFTDLRYGQPAYLQLALIAPREIAHGAEDGSEMGVYCHLKQPQREVNLRQRLDEYVPFGLESGVIYET